MQNTHMNELRTRLALERPELNSDGAGGSSLTWVKVADVWAKIKPVSSTENFTNHQTANRLTHQITIRYRDDVLPEMRLTKNERVFEILDVMNHQERRRWLFLDCREQQL